MNIFVKSFLYNIEKMAVSQKGWKIIGNTLLASPLVSESIHLGKSMSDQKKVVEEFKKNQTKFKGKIPRNINIIKNEKQMDEWINNNLHGIKKVFLKNQYKNLLKTKNAFITLPTKEGRPSLILPPNMDIDKVISHELGHYKDIKNQGILTSGEFNKKLYKPLKSYFHSIFRNPKTSPMYKTEERAWDLAKIPSNDPLRRKALKTYENKITVMRPSVYAIPPSIIGALILAKKVKL